MNEKTATVSYPRETREVMLDPKIPVSEGDFVMVQMGVVIARVTKKQALESFQAWSS